MFLTISSSATLQTLHMLLYVVSLLYRCYDVVSLEPYFPQKVVWLIKICLVVSEMFFVDIEGISLHLQRTYVNIHMQQQHKLYNNEVRDTLKT